LHKKKVSQNNDGLTFPREKYFTISTIPDHLAKRLSRAGASAELAGINFFAPE
jgi:hypothetical protein